MAKTLATGTPTVVWQFPGSAGRLYALFSPPGRQSGMLWAERDAADPWTETDRSYLRLSARLIERSTILSAELGSVIEPERLQQRLGDAAVIAGRMAHEFDNILTGIIGFTDLSVPLVPAGSQAARFLAEIGKVGQRGILFTQQLHQLSRSGRATPQPGSVAVAVAREEERLRPNLPEGMGLRTEIPDDLGEVNVEAGPLGVVLGHLIKNALEATPADGDVTVTARPVDLTPTDASEYLGQVSPGPHVEVTVRDYGPGIKPEVRAKLFAEPFFTTKVRHRGLGLAVVYRTLFAHRGGVRLDPAPGPGTMARVVLPLAPARLPVAFAALTGTSTSTT